MKSVKVCIKSVLHCTLYHKCLFGYFFEAFGAWCIKNKQTSQKESEKYFKISTSQAPTEGPIKAQNKAPYVNFHILN